MTEIEYGPKTPLAIELDEMKYRLKGETFKESRTRVANALKDNDEHYHDFRDSLLGQYFLPGGRVLSAVGAPREVTPFNCFVSMTIEDSMDSIMDAAKYAATTMRLGGGIGYDFSNIRPRGTNIVTLDSRASGPVSFMGIFDAICKTISSAGHRRGAQMGCLRVDHPDIEEFISCKSDNTTLTQFNLSVLVTDEFMKAVDNNSMFQLRFEGRVYKQVRARYLWEKIMRQTWDYAEPGVIFVDRINRKNNLWYCETIAATNPCVRGDTSILTDSGYRKIEDCLDGKTTIWNGYQFSEVQVEITGVNQEMVTVSFSDGSSLDCTPYHKFILSDMSRVEARNLKEGDKLVKCEWPVIAGFKVLKDAYAQGFFTGDGWVKAENGSKYIGLYGEKKYLVSKFPKPISAHEYAIGGGFEGTKQGTKIYLNFGNVDWEDKYFVPDASYTVESRLEWLAGIIDSDGHVTKDGCAQITAKDFGFLKKIKMMLNTLGVNGSIGDMKDMFRLSISASDFWDLGLDTKAQAVKPSRNASRFVKVQSVSDAVPADKVYCFNDPLNHSGIFGGVITAQCGEQPLAPHAACLLGSMNLTKFVKVNDEGKRYFDYADFKRRIPAIVRAMDNINDIAIYPLPEQKESAHSKRRMGLGVTGLANAGEGIGLRYGSDEFMLWAREVFTVYRDECYRQSIELAKEKGPFPLFNAELYLQSEFAQTLPDDIRSDIARYGIRNSHLLSIAPTGTISNVADNVSSGIEPPFSLYYDRVVQTFEGPKTERVSDYAYREWGVEGVTALEIDVQAHVDVLCLASEFVDSACSKTINVGNDVTWEQFQAVYVSAYEGGASGCTTFRAAGKRAGILTAATSEDVAEPEEGGSCVYDPVTGIKSCE